jgi:outer membrane receptor protein involved in Fe transport
MFLVAVQGRAESNEFDDDRNQFPLGSFFVLSATVSHPLPKGFDIFFQGENLTNEVYNIGKTPVPTIGQPILVRGGLRWQSRR